MDLTEDDDGIDDNENPMDVEVSGQKKRSQSRATSEVKQSDAKGGNKESEHDKDDDEDNIGADEKSNDDDHSESKGENEEADPEEQPDADDKKDDDKVPNHESEEKNDDDSEEEKGIQNDQSNPEEEEDDDKPEEEKDHFGIGVDYGDDEPPTGKRKRKSRSPAKQPTKRYRQASQQAEAEKSVNPTEKTADDENQPMDTDPKNAGDGKTARVEAMKQVLRMKKTATTKLNRRTPIKPKKRKYHVWLRSLTKPIVRLLFQMV